MTTRLTNTTMAGGASGGDATVWRWALAKGSPKLGMLVMGAFLAAACGSQVASGQQDEGDPAPPPRPEIPVSEILDDPAMDEIADIVHSGDDSDRNVYAFDETQFFDDFDRNIAGSGFFAERAGVVIVDSDTTYLAATGVVRDIDGNTGNGAVYVQRLRSGTVEIVSSEIVPIPECGKAAAVLSTHTLPSEPVVTVTCGDRTQFKIDLSTSPPMIELVR